VVKCNKKDSHKRGRVDRERGGETESYWLGEKAGDKDYLFFLLVTTTITVTPIIKHGQGTTRASSRGLTRPPKRELLRGQKGGQPRELCHNHDVACTKAVHSAWGAPQETLQIPKKQGPKACKK
jgi:hypothetical protein